MADPDLDRDPAPQDGDQSPKRNRILQLVLSRKKWIGLGAGLLLLVVVGICVVQAGGSAGSPPGSEVTLGEFEFSSGDVTGVMIKDAKFTLHVSLLRKAEQSGRKLLEDRQFKVQQEVEQLLRRAKSADFEDPLLADLKRQMQELINETLGAHVIEEIIITDLALTRAEALDMTQMGSAAASTSADSSAEVTSTEAPAISPLEADVIY